jgi:hypothetical protein
MYEFFFLITYVNIGNFDTQLSILHSKFLSLQHVDNFRENIYSLFENYYLHVRLIIR